MSRRVAVNDNQTRCKLSARGPKLVAQLKAFENKVLDEHDLEIYDMISSVDTTGVFSGRLLSTDEDVVVKITPMYKLGQKYKDYNSVINETHNLQLLTEIDSKITVDFINSFNLDCFSFLVTEKITGQNLVSYFNSFRGNREEETRILLIQILKLLKVFHSQEHLKGHVCGNISPNDFVMTPEKDLYMINIGGSKLMTSTKLFGNIVAGNSMYMSVATMLEEDTDVNDDIESVVYLLSMFYERTLPWQGLDGLKDREEIIRLKEDFVPKHPELRDLLEELREK